MSGAVPAREGEGPAEVAGRIERWLRYRVGDVYAMAGRGAGRIVELNPALDVIRLEVAGARVPLSLVSADKNLTPLPPGHFLRDKVEDSRRSARSVGAGAGRGAAPTARELRIGR